MTIYSQSALFMTIRQLQSRQQSVNFSSEL